MNGKTDDTEHVGEAVTWGDVAAELLLLLVRLETLVERLEANTSVA